MGQDVRGAINQLGQISIFDKLTPKVIESAPESIASKPRLAWIIESRWRWTFRGFLASFCSYFLVPWNLAFLSPVHIWMLWVLFPFGFLTHSLRLPLLGEVVVWLGPPTVYGLLLSVTSGTKWSRATFYSLLIFHTMAVCVVALT